MEAEPRRWALPVIAAIAVVAGLVAVGASGDDVRWRVTLGADWLLPAVLAVAVALLSLPRGPDSIRLAGFVLFPIGMLAVFWVGVQLVADQDYQLSQVPVKVLLFAALGAMVLAVLLVARLGRVASAVVALAFFCLAWWHAVPVFEGGALPYRVWLCPAGFALTGLGLAAASTIAERR